MPLIRSTENHYAKGKTPKSFHLSDELLLTIPKKILTYLKKDPNDDQINPHLLEFFVYKKMCFHLKREDYVVMKVCPIVIWIMILIQESAVDDVEKIAAEFGYSQLHFFAIEQLDEAIE